MSNERTAERVNVLPAYDMNTKARTHDDGFTGPATVIERQGRDILVRCSAGFLVWVIEGRIEQL